MAEENRNEGSVVKLIRRTVYPGTMRMDHRASHPLIIEARESPREAFEYLFPRYQIARYKGIPLGDRKDFKFFSHDRWSGLSIDVCANGSGEIKYIPRGNIGKALRTKDRRNPGYLGVEANIILTKVLPYMQNFCSCTSGKLADTCRLVTKELALAFDNIRSQGKIR